MVSKNLISFVHKIRAVRSSIQKPFLLYFRVTPSTSLYEKADICDHNQDQHKGSQKVAYSTLMFLQN